MAEKSPPENRYGIDVVRSDEGGVFVAIIPDMPYAGGHGETVEDALAMAEEAIRSYIEVAEATGRPVPPPVSGRIA